MMKDKVVLIESMLRMIDQIKRVRLSKRLETEKVDEEKDRVKRSPRRILVTNQTQFGQIHTGNFSTVSEK